MINFISLSVYPSPQKLNINILRSYMSWARLRGATMADLFPETVKHNAYGGSMLGRH